MIAVGATMIMVLALLLASELWLRTHKNHGEFSREFIQITVGTFVAFWPFFLTQGEIIILAAAFLLVVAASKEQRIFKAIHSVDRTTWGELFFALAVGVTAFITTSRAIYAIALLHMSLADGMAALIGTRFGGKTRYKIFGVTKSLVGTATFIVVSVCLLTAFSLTGNSLSIGHIALLAVGAALIENLGILGLDNLLVPVIVALVLINA